jgi:sugar phosphate isomerase/epimerase
MFQERKEVDASGNEKIIKPQGAADGKNIAIKSSNKENLNVICVSTWTQMNLEGDVAEKQKLILKSIKAAKILGANIVNTYFGPNPKRDLKASLSTYQRNIDVCLNAAEKERIVIVLENEFEKSGTDITRRAENVLKLVQQIDSPYFRLNFDPCNFYFAGEEPFPYAYSLLKNYVKYIHLKDGMKYSVSLHEYPGDDYFWQDASGDYICTSMGKGAIPWEAFLKELMSDEYDGYLTLEPHVPESQLRSTFSESVSYLLTLLNRVVGNKQKEVL